MKPVSELYNQYPDSDIYVVGTGASLRTFPISFLEDKVTIGLNMAWKSVPVKYAITIHPDLCVPEFIPDEKPHPEITWIAKYEKTKGLVTTEQFKYADKNFYFFEMDGRQNTQPPHQPSDEGRILEWVQKPTANKLYQWSSISQTAVNLAANMGAKNIILVGCDNCSLANNHHAHKQHARWRWVDPNQRYHQYYQGLAEVRTALRKRDINLTSLTPFVSLANPEQDFERLCEELNQPKLLNIGADISPKIPLKAYLKHYVERFAVTLKNKVNLLTGKY